LLVTTFKILQLLGDFVPQTLYQRFTPGPCWGTPVALHYVYY